MLSGFQRKISCIGVLIALVFAVNLLAAVPNQAVEFKADIGHEISSKEHVNATHAPVQKAHDHVKMCGMHTCNFRIEEDIIVFPIQFAESTAFSAIEGRLNGLLSSPPTEPPKA